MTRVGSLRDVVEKSTGTRNPAVQPDDEFTYVDVSAIDNQQKIINGARLLLGSEAPSRARKLLRANDVLVSTVRPNLNAVALVPSELDGQVGSTGFCVLRAMPSWALPEYLFYFVRSQRFVDALAGLVAGALYPAVTDSQVLDQELPLPSLSEQRRIVDLLSRAEGIVRLRRLAQQKAAALIPAIFVDMFGDPATNPKGWPTKSLRELVEFQSGGTPSKARDDYWQGDVPWVSPKDMKRMALYDAIDHINSLVLSETSLKLVPPGSVLIVVRGMILAHTVPVAEARVPLTVNQDMKAMVSKGEISSTYLLWMLQVCHDRLLAQVTTAAHGTKKLDTARLEEMVIPMPPMAVQQAFASSVQRVEAIQEHQVNAMTKAEAAFQALLARAFSATGQAAVGRTQEEATA